MLEVALSDAEAIVAYAAEALQKWPPLEQKMKTKQRHGNDRAAPPREDRQPHEWEYRDGAWRCSKCLHRAIVADANPSGTRGYCSGRGTNCRADEAAAHGHSVAIAEGNGVPVMFCLKCGAWTARRGRGMAKCCPGAPTAAGKQALFNIARGKRPWRPPNTAESDRATFVAVGPAASKKRPRETNETQMEDDEPGLAAATPRRQRLAHQPADPEEDVDVLDMPPTLAMYDDEI